jgi:hypothetical protein
LNPSERLGSEETGGMNNLKAHLFFNETNWDNLLNQQSPLEAKAKLSSRPKTNTEL